MVGGSAVNNAATATDTRTSNRTGEHDMNGSSVSKVDMCTGNLRRWCAAALATATLLLASAATADGLATDASALPAATRSKLAADIAAYKQTNPEAFAAVANVQGYRPEVYRQFRNPIPMVGRELRHLGKPALLPMLDALAFHRPDVSQASAQERQALIVGMLEAVGHQRDARGSAVAQAIFKADNHPSLVTQTAAEAMGQLCDDSSLELLSTSLASPKRMAAIDGLGECRNVEAAQLLADQLDASTSAGEAERIASAMGVMSSSWAWETLGNERAAEGLTVRTIASEALSRGFLRYDGAARDAHRRGLIMAQLPELAVIAEANAVGADARAAAQLRELVKLVVKRSHTNEPTRRYTTGH